MVTKYHFLECYSLCNHCNSLTKLNICLYLSVSNSVLNQKFWKTLQTFWKLRSGQVLCIIWCAIPTQLNVCFCLYWTKKLQVIFYGIDQRVLSGSTHYIFLRLIQNLKSDVICNFCKRTKSGNSWELVVTFRLNLKNLVMFPHIF